MLTPRIKKTAFITVALILSISTVAFAHGRWDRDGRMDGYGPGKGYHMGRDGGGYRADCPYVQGDQAKLTNEQIAKIDAARDKFYKATETLRRQIRDKRIALGDVMETEKPDVAKVKPLQKELNQLENQFDELALEHQLEMRALFPEGTGRGGYGMGRNRGLGRNYCGR